MKKVLIITYHFPPDAAVGAVRPAKFAKYLPEFGWEPIIYTVKEEYYEGCDYTKFDPALKNLKIYRANLIPGPSQLYSQLFLKKNKCLAPPINPQNDKTIRQKEVSSIRRFIRSILGLPDDKQGWIANIVIDGYRILKRHNIDTLITSGPPMSTHIGGLLLKSVTRAKWVADFRDPWWPGVRWRDVRYRTVFSDAIHKKLESKVIGKADLVISVAPTMGEYFKSNLRLNQQDKCVTITNGFDESDFNAIDPVCSKENSKIRISYAGNLYGDYANRDPEPFFAALAKLVDEGRIKKEQILIEFIGDCSEYNGMSVLGLIEKYELAPMVQLKGRIPYRDCIQRLMDSNALLLFATGVPEQITTKLFEYLRINRPIFAIAVDGDAKSILRSFENSFIANPDNINDIAEKFLQMLKAVNNNELLLSSREKIDKYDRRHLTGELALCLEQVSNKY